MLCGMYGLNSSMDSSIDQTASLVEIDEEKSLIIGIGF